jgi:hypothetical protein
MILRSINRLQMEGRKTLHKSHNLKKRGKASKAYKMLRTQMSSYDQINELKDR